MAGTIYALEEDGLLIYIGATARPEGRQRRQESDYRRVGREVTFHVLEEDPPDGLQAAERRWIADGLSWGWPLENRSAGGEASTLEIPKSDSHRAALSASLMGHPVSAETRSKISETLAGVPLRSEHKAAISTALTGVPRSPFTDAHRAALCAAWDRRRAKIGST
jgi:hypothetical protein